MVSIAKTIAKPTGVPLGSNLNLVFGSANSFTVPENQSSVGTVIATSGSSYSIVAGGDGDLFDINSETGILTKLSSFDYETKNSFILTVRATKELFHKDQEITITVQNIVEYPTITIGTQEWVAKNFDEIVTAMGTAIPEITDTTAWTNAVTPAWCYLDNNSANNATKGKMYNKYAVDLINNDIIAFNALYPNLEIQYEVPTKLDLETAIAFAGGSTVAGGKLKKVTGWANPNTGATDEYGFAAIPTGLRSQTGAFSSQTTMNDIWTLTNDASTTAWMVRLTYDSDDTFMVSVDKKRGLSLRLKKKNNPMMIQSVPDDDVVKIALYGDSIFASGFEDNSFPDEFGISQYEQPFRTGQLKGFTKSIYDYLNFNKPKFRSAKHADWTHTGTSSFVDSHVMPNAPDEGASGQWDKLLAMTSASGNESTINVAGCDKCIFAFEGGTIGDASETGVVNITVSVNGGAFVNPSTVLQGKKNGASFDAALDVYDTAFANPEILNPYNKYQAFREVIYNGLITGNTYTFKITRASTEPNVYVLGCYYSIGQTLLVINQSKPGMTWGELRGCAYPDLANQGISYVILQAPMYHDPSLASAESQATATINEIKSYGINVALCSCPPGGVIVTGRPTAILSDENSSAYMPGQNFVKYFDGLRIFTTSDLASASEAPSWNDVYRAVIGGVNYDMTGNTASGNLSATSVRLTAESNFPIKSAITFPITLTKISGNANSKAQIIVTGVNDYYTMSQHRDLMKSLANSLNLQFVDLYKSFVDLAVSAGETIYQDGYNMPTNHPLYAYASSFIGQPGYDNLSLPLKMNYMSNFFNIGDGHHLSNAAHDIIFTKLRDAIFQNSPLV